LHKNLRAAVELPTGVHKVQSRGHTYFYFQVGRGTDSAGKRVRLPNDPRTPEFWTALRQAQGLAKKGGGGNTVNTLIDAYTAHTDFTSCSQSSQDKYIQYLQIVREAWGEIDPNEIDPTHDRELMDTLSETPAKANSVLTVIRNISDFGIARKGFNKRSLCEGVKRYEMTGGHKPWTPEQIKVAMEKLTGVVRRGFVLYLYTGQRGSDVVRIGWTSVDDNGFRLTQQKTTRPVWCPIVPNSKQR
jgi:hypothetical protein